MVKAIPHDKFFKVTKAFLEILSKYLVELEVERIDKQDFMNHSIWLYSSRKDEVDTLVRTYENLGRCESQSSNPLQYEVSRNSVLNHSVREPAYMHGLNLSSVTGSSKLKASSLAKNSLFSFSSRKLGKFGERFRPSGYKPNDPKHARVFFSLSYSYLEFEQKELSVYRQTAPVFQSHGQFFKVQK